MRTKNLVANSANKSSGEKKTDPQKSVLPKPTLRCCFDPPSVWNLQDKFVDFHRFSLPSPGQFSQPLVSQFQSSLVKFSQFLPIRVSFRQVQASHTRQNTRMSYRQEGEAKKRLPKPTLICFYRYTIGDENVTKLIRKRVRQKVTFARLSGMNCPRIFLSCTQETHMQIPKTICLE